MEERKDGFIMKKARLVHDQLRGFYLANFKTGEYIADVDAGDIEDDIDWAKIEVQAAELGYQVDQSDYSGTFPVDVE